MGIYSGGISLSRFQVMGYKKSSITALNDMLDKFKSKRFNLHKQTSEEMIGWVPPHTAHEEITEGNSHWSLSDCEIQDGYLLRMRIDKRRVPKQLLQLVLKGRLFEMKEKLGKIPRNKKQDLQEEIHQELMAKALPNITYVDAFWKPHADEVLVFTRGKHACELLDRLFTHTFLDKEEGGLIKLELPTPPSQHTGNKSETMVEILRHLPKAIPDSFIQ